MSMLSGLNEHALSTFQYLDYGGYFTSIIRQIIRLSKNVGYGGVILPL